MEILFKNEEVKIINFLLMIETDLNNEMRFHLWHRFYKCNSYNAIIAFNYACNIGAEYGVKYSSFITDSYRFWVGATDEHEEGSWIWTTSGRSFSGDTMFTDWITNPPNPDNGGGNEHCLDLIDGFGNEIWNDAFCDMNLPYLCEYN